MFQGTPFPVALVFAAGVILGLLAGSVATAAMFYPGLAKAIARVKAVGLLAVGVGLLVWGIVCLSGGQEFKAPFELSVMRSAVECIAWGSGILAAGVLSLVLGFVGVIPSRTEP